MKDGGWRGRSGQQSRWREDGCRESRLRDRSKDDRLSLMKGHLENAALGSSCRKNNQTNRKKWHNSRPSLWLLFCVCAIRRGKHCDISRPSYSNQKIKVPFFPAVATNLNHLTIPPLLFWHLIAAKLTLICRWCQSRIYSFNIFFF